MAKGDRCFDYPFCEVREMRNAEINLEIIRERGKRGLPLERVYRLLFNPELYLQAYGRLYRKAGAMTPGATPETVDAMSLEKIDTLIQSIRNERYQWTPVRRTYIPKANGKLRPLGVPTWSDKLLQEVIRTILEAYYEPQFSSHSHGFRPQRGCHTALHEIDRLWLGTSWFIEADVSRCFESLDHQVLLSILREKVHDQRMINLIADLLKAGYLENWTFNQTLSGAPQGAVLSPLLSNVYLDRLDQYVEQTLLPEFNRGTRRKPNPEYDRKIKLAYEYRQKGRFQEAATLVESARQLPSCDNYGADYRRLRYVRYADDFLLGFAGPRQEAEEIKCRLKEFLHEELKLELSEEKTLITHARTQPARFLGYEVMVLDDDCKRAANGRRNLNGQIALKVPVAVIKEKCGRDMRNGKAVHRTELLHHSVFSIVSQYQAEYRGLVQYYLLANNIHRLHRLKWVMETSLTKTIAAKLRISVSEVYHKFGTTILTPAGSYQGLMVQVEREEGKAPLVARWGGIPLRRQKNAVLNDHPPKVWNTKTELLERLLAEICELCGSTEKVEVHHVRHLADLQKPGRAKKPYWVKIMAARHRKTLIVCRKCHDAIHAGQMPAARMA